MVTPAYNSSLASHCTSDEAQCPLNGPQGDTCLAPFSFLVIPGGTIFHFVRVLHTGIAVILENSVTPQHHWKQTVARTGIQVGRCLQRERRPLASESGTCLGCGRGPAVWAMLLTLSFLLTSSLIK